MSRELAAALQRLMIRSDYGPMRATWERSYEIVVRTVGSVLTLRVPGSTVYLRGSGARGELHHGVSDIDMAVVVPAGRREQVRRRWRKLTAVLPALERLIEMAIYSPEELSAVSSSSTLTAVRAVHLGPAAPPDDAGISLRPGLSQRPLRHWRPVRGRDIRPQPSPSDAQQRRIGAWLELQDAWRDAFRACLRPDAPRTSLSCIKLVADPVRVLLGITTTEQPTSREDVLQLGSARLPDESEVLARMLALERRLHRAKPPLDEALSACLRLSSRTARELECQVRDAGTTAVELIGAGEELALPPDPMQQLQAMLDGEPRLLPLADWRARSWPLHPDDAFAPVELDPADPELLARAVRAAGGYGPYPTLAFERLMIVAGPGLLRAVQCRLTDPVSFALACGSAVASFPNVAGWSAHDCARRAVAEHRAWLGVDAGEGTDLLAHWIEAQARTSAPANDVLGWLLSAGRAGLFLESIEAGRPELAVTIAAAAERVGQADAFAEYRSCRLSGVDPDPGTVHRVRETVLGMPAYAYQTRLPIPLRAAIER